MPYPLILLAAGGSSRMGRPKQLLPYRGSTLLRHAANTAFASRCSQVMVVIGSSADQMRQELAGLSVQIVENPKWERGMGSSIRVGLQAILAKSLPQDASLPAPTHSSPSAAISGLIIMLCDQPAVTADLLNQLIDAHDPQHSPIVACAYAGVAGVPALFDGTLIDDLLRLEDSSGARSLISRSLITRSFLPGSAIEEHFQSPTLVPFPGGAIDVDRPEDYEQLTQANSDRT